MTALAQQYMHHNGLGSERGKSRVGRKLTFWWEQLVCPANGALAHGMSTGQACEVFRWLVTTAECYREHGVSGPTDCLNGGSTCINSSIAPFCGENWKGQMRARFLNALLCPFASGSTNRWRRDLNILLGQPEPMVLPIRSYKPTWTGGPMSSHALECAITEMLTIFQGGRLKRWHNEYHKHARWVERACLYPFTSGWCVSVLYGYRNDSGWAVKPEIRQGPREVFDDFVIRATAELHELIDVKRTQKAVNA